MVHIVYCDGKEKELDKILSGEKTMVIRGSVSRKIPHSRVFIDDILYFTVKGSNTITAKAIVKDVENYSKLSLEDIEKVLEDNAYKLNLTPNQVKKVKKQCLCLVEFQDVESISPMEFVNKRVMDDWLIVEDIKNIVV